MPRNLNVSGGAPYGTFQPDAFPAENQIPASLKPDAPLRISFAIPCAHLFELPQQVFEIVRNRQN